MKKDLVLKKIPKNVYFILAIALIFAILALGASVYAIIFRKGLLKVQEKPSEMVDGNIDLGLESSDISSRDAEIKVSLSIYPERANPISVGVIIFQYDTSKIKLTNGNLRDTANGGLPSSDQFVLHNVSGFTGGTFVEPKEDELCATSGYVCFTLAYVKESKFFVENDNQKGVLADLIFKPVEGETFSQLAGECLNFNFVKEKTSFGKLEGAYDNIDFNDLIVRIKE